MYVSTCLCLHVCFYLYVSTCDRYRWPCTLIISVLVYTCICLLVCVYMNVSTCDRYRWPCTLIFSVLVYIYMYVSTCMCPHMCLLVCVYLYVSTCMCLLVCVHFHVTTCMCLLVCLFVFFYMYVSTCDKYRQPSTLCWIQDRNGCFGISSQHRKQILVVVLFDLQKKITTNLVWYDCYLYT